MYVFFQYYIRPGGQRAVTLNSKTNEYDFRLCVRENNNYRKNVSIWRNIPAQL